MALPPFSKTQLSRPSWEMCSRKCLKAQHQIFSFSVYLDSQDGNNLVDSIKINCQARKFWENAMYLLSSYAICLDSLNLETPGSFR